MMKINCKQIREIFHILKLFSVFFSFGDIGASYCFNISDDLCINVIPILMLVIIFYGFRVFSLIDLDKDFGGGGSGYGAPSYGGGGGGGGLFDGLGGIFGGISGGISGISILIIPLMTDVNCQAVSIEYFLIILL